MLLRLDIAAILEIAVKIALVITCAALISGRMRRASAATRHLVWTAAIAVSLLMPVGALIFPRVRVPVLPALPETTPVESGIISARDLEHGQSAQHVDSHTSRQPTLMASPAVHSGKEKTPPAIFFWLLGFGAIATYWIAGRLALWQVTRLTSPVTEGPLRDAMNYACHQLEMRSAPRLRLGPSIHVPFTVGIIQPKVFLPQSAIVWRTDQMHSTLLHEVAHVKRRDYAIHLVTQLACAIYWFHPLVWMAVRRLRAEAELACDDAVLRNHAAEPANYAEHLLLVATALRGVKSWRTPAIAMGRPSGLRQRIFAILDASVNRRSLSVQAVVLLLMVTAMAFSGVSCAHLSARAGSHAGLATSTAAALHAKPRSFVVTVLDNETGKPLDNVEILYDNFPKDGRVLTDAEGHATVTLAHGDIDPKLVLWRDHYLGSRVMWRPVKGAPPPPLSTCTLRLEPTHAIGGKVIDDAGNPIAGAQVEFWINGKQTYQSGLSVERPWTNRAVKTAADGTWQYDNSRAPVDAKSIMVAAWDYQHLDGDYFILKNYIPVADLFAKTSVLTLPRGVPVSGTVREPFYGSPIPGAKISFGADPGASNKIPPLTADAQGKFTFAAKPGSIFTITASSAGYKPQVQSYIAQRQPATLEFHLTPLHIQ